MSLFLFSSIGCFCSGPGSPRGVFRNRSPCRASKLINSPAAQPAAAVAPVLQITYQTQNNYIKINRNTLLPTGYRFITREITYSFAMHHLRRNTCRSIALPGAGLEGRIHIQSDAQCSTGLRLAQKDLLPELLRTVKKKIGNKNENRQIRSEKTNGKFRKFFKSCAFLKLGIIHYC